MRCKVCGAETGLTHNCPGAAAIAAADAVEAPPEGFGIGHYIRDGWAIACWNEAAIRRTSRDPNALVFGGAFFAVSLLVIFAVRVLVAMSQGLRVTASGLFVAGIVQVCFGAVWQLGYLGICHLLAKKLLGGNGTYLGILRPMLLSSFVFCTLVIPVVGVFVAGAWWGLAILLWVFEEVHHVERLQTLAILVGMNITLLVLRMATPLGQYL